MPFVAGAFRAISDRMPFGRQAAPAEWLAPDPREMGAMTAAADKPAPAGRPSAVAQPSAASAPDKPAPAKRAPAKRAATGKQDAASTAASTAATGTASATKATATKAAAKKTTVKKTAATKTTAKQQGSAAPAATKPAPRRRAAVAESAGAVAVHLPPVRSGEEPWTEEEVAEVAAELRRERDRLLEEIADSDAQLAEMLRDAGDNAVDDQADAGSRTFEREQQLSLAANTAEMLAQVDHALRRLQTGGYGLCESCGQPISKVRLQAFPRATLCLSCKEREERR